MTPALGFALTAAAMPYITHLAVVAARFHEGYDLHQPRIQSINLTGWGARAWAAEMNAFEAAIPAAVVFLAAHLLQTDPSWVWGFGLGWTLARLGHWAAYLANRPRLRSGMFGLANLCLVGLVGTTVL